MNQLPQKQESKKYTALKELESIEAQTSPQHGISKTLHNLFEFIDQIPLEALALTYLGEELKNANGEDRHPTQKEAAVIITEHFMHTLDMRDHGIAMLNGTLHFYHKDHWLEVTSSEAQRALGEFAEAIGHKVTEARYFRVRETLLSQILTTAPMIERPSGQTLVNFSNGTLHINHDQESLVPHEKADAFTYVLPFSYEPTASAPKFQKYINRVLPDQQCQTVLAEFFGWIFLRDLKIEKMLMLYGHGHNGKSVLFDIITALLGNENISHIGMDSLKTPESRLPLVGKLLNYGSEVAGTVKPDIVKKAASGEPMEFRKLYGDTFTTDNYSRLAFNANNLPPDVEHTEGYFRRFLIIPFEQTITAEEKDPDLASKIIANEMPGVMNWILDGMKRLRTARKFSPCAKSDECLGRYQHESDTTAQFLDEENYKQCVEMRISKLELFGRYREYCSLNGYKSLGKRKFNDRLGTHHRIQGGKHGDIGYFWHLTQSN